MALAGEGIGGSQLLGAAFLCATTHARYGSEVERKLSNLMARLAPTGSSSDRSPLSGQPASLSAFGGKADIAAKCRFVRL
jgi:hypothetical protein